MTVSSGTLRALAAAATPGPWERGEVWMRAGVKAEMFGEGKCAGCKRNGPPEWEGHDDINGTQMLAHLHRVPDPWDRNHHLSGPNGTTVVGMYDYEAGGFLRGEDAALASLAPELAVLLADAMDELQAWRDLYGPDEAEGVESASPSTDALLARFRALEERAGGQTEGRAGDGR